MTVHNHRLLHLPHWSFNWRLPGLTGLYLNACLRNFSIAMVNIFIPLFILKTTGKIEYIFIFYIYYHTFEVLLDYPLIFLMTKIGPDRSVLISNILLGCYLFSIALLKQNFSFIFLAALFNALMVPLYWIPYHLAFIKLGKEEKYGESVSYFSIFGRLSTALGPVAGGLIIVLFGFEKLFTAVVIFIMISTIPLFLDRFKRVSKAPPLDHILRGLIKSDYRDNLLAFWGVSLESLILAIFWPIFIYKVVNSYKIVGFISSLGLFLSMVMLFWVGKRVNRKGQGMLKVGVLTNSVNWLVRIFLNSGWQIFLADFFYNLGAALLWTPFDTMVYRKAIDSDPFDFLIKRELSLHVGGLLASLLVWFVWAFIPNWFVIFSLGAIGLFLTGLMIKNIHKVLDK